MIKNIRVFIRKRLEKLLSKRTKRNLRKKFNKLKDKFEPVDLYKTNLLVNSKKKANYNMIMNSVRSKNNYLVIENSHKGKKEKKILIPKVIWPSSRGTYTKQKMI